jgi:hypothetical protein
MPAPPWPCRAAGCRNPATRILRMVLVKSRAQVAAMNVCDDDDCEAQARESMAVRVQVLPIGGGSVETL